MSALLKQSTTVTIRIGPFLDAGDGVTEEVGLGSMGVEVSKNHGAFAARNSATATAHDAEGWYSCELDATDTNTLGPLIVKAHASATHLPVWREFVVVPAMIYDSLVAGSDVLQADVTQLLGTAWLTPGTAGTPDVNTKLAGGTAWGSGAITAGAIATDAITAAKIAADAIGASELAADAVAEIVAALPTVGGIADAVWDEATSGHIAAGSFGEAVDAIKQPSTGGFDRSTDSLASIREHQDLMAGSGFSGSSHSLAALRTAVGSLVTANNATGGSGTSGTLVSLGFLSRMVNLVRREVDTPSINAKYSDAALIDELRLAWTQLWTDLNGVGDSQIIVSYDITVVADRREYPLPPVVGQVVRLYKVDASTDLALWELIPRSHYHPSGPTWELQGNMLVLGSKWSTGDTLRLEYIPNGEVYPFEGSALLADFDIPEGESTTVGARVVIAVDRVTGGTLDRRPNAYGGYVFRIVDATNAGGTSINTYPLQDRIVKEFFHQGFYMTLRAPLDPLPDGSEGKKNFKYELVPYLWAHTELCTAYMAARGILSREGLDKKYNLVTQLYREAVRASRLQLSRMQGRRGAHLEGDVTENRRFGFPRGNS